VNTPRRDEHLTVEQYLEAWDLALAIRRDDRPTPAERAAAAAALAECLGLPWREEWVVR
jgi:hypothetical protein